jgi:hypothetical protein
MDELQELNDGNPSMLKGRLYHTLSGGPDREWFGLRGGNPRRLTT